MIRPDAGSGARGVHSGSLDTDGTEPRILLPVGTAGTFLVGTLFMEKFATFSTCQRKISRLCGAGVDVLIAFGARVTPTCKDSVVHGSDLMLVSINMLGNKRLHDVLGKP